MENEVRDLIAQRIDEWVEEFIGRDFQFRKYQKEKIVDIIENITSTHENHTHLIEAPTGSGKSLIIIIAAGVLSKYYNLESYILCSDLFLWNQYANFIKDNPKIKFGMLKGQGGNYICDMNGEDIKTAECKLAQISWASLFNEDSAIKLGFPCAMDCEYVQARKRAINASVVLMTYQLFFYTMYFHSKTNNDSKTNLCPKPIIFCDECHNITDIIQNKFSPSMSNKVIEKFMFIYDYSAKQVGSLFTEGYEIHNKYTRNEILEKLNNIFESLCDTTKSKEDDFECLQDMIKIFVDFSITVSTIENSLGLNKRSGKFISQEDKDVYKGVSAFHTYESYWEDLRNAIEDENVGYQYLIKKVDENDEGEKTVHLGCSKEDYMIYKYILCSSKWRVMLSATVGGHNAFDENNGLKYTKEKQSKFDTVPSTFDFSKSPIRFLNRYKMTFKEKDKSFEALKEIIYSIIDKFKGKKGIIQTGNYDFAKKLIFYAPPHIKDRLLFYNGSKEKITITSEHKLREDTILVGPTLYEGIDLPDDLCRFIIIMKVPYPNLKDVLVKEKIKLFPLWYNSKTSNSIIQGIGRGVRNENDYCETFILDACFYNLYVNTMSQYPLEMQKRIILYN